MRGIGRLWSGALSDRETTLSYGKTLEEICTERYRKLLAIALDEQTRSKWSGLGKFELVP